MSVKLSEKDMVVLLKSIYFVVFNNSDKVNLTLYYGSNENAMKN